MSIPSLYFDRIIRWLPETSRRESVKFWRAKKNSFLLGGFRIQDNEFKNSKSSVCKRVLQLCNKQTDAAIVWLAGLAHSTPNSPIGEFYFPDYAKDPSALTLAQVDSLSAVPPFTMCVFSAQVLNEALKRIRERPAENKSQEADNAIFEELDADFNRIVEAVPALREFLAADEGTAEEASDEKSEKAEKSVKEEKAAKAAPETSSTIEKQPPSTPEASKVAHKEKEAPIAPEQDDAANPSIEEEPSPAQEAADAQSTEIRPTSEAVDKRPPVVEEPIPRRFTLGIPFLSITEPAPGNRRVLGCVRQIGSFFNFYPTAVFEDGAWMPITMTEARERFPKFGGINLFSQQRRTFLTTTPYLLDWGETELIKTAESNPDYGIRLNADQVFHDGLMRPASDLGGFVVVYPENGRMPGPNESDLVRVSFSPKPLNEKPDASGRPINVAELLGFLNTPVLVAADDRFYGPYRLAEDASGNRYVKIGADCANGLLKGYELPSEAALLRLSRYCRVSETDWRSIPYDFLFAAGLEATVFDRLEPLQLLDKLGGVVSATREERKALEWWLLIGVERTKLFSDDDRVRDARLERIMRVLRRDDRGEECIAAILKLLEKLVATQRSEALINAVAEHIVDNQALLDRVAEYGKLKQSINDVLGRLEALQTEEAAAKASVEALKQNIRVEAEAENKALLDETAALRADVEQKRAVLGNIVECSDAIEMQRMLKSEIDTAEKRLALFEKETDALDSKLRAAVENASGYAFDGAIAGKFMNAAALWEKSRKTDIFDARAKAVSALPISNLRGSALASYLVQSVRDLRSYDTNTILSVFIAFTQSFLSILAGPPGTGKTSAAGIFAHALGLTTVHAWLAKSADLANCHAEGFADRYLPVSVERGWTSKRDFIGFHNSLSNRFDSPDIRRYEAFRELDAEKRAGTARLPYFILLDEANLSPIEFYWADFMNVADKQSDFSFITLGDDERCMIPETLRFIATINSDFTTESLSPRLIDRAAVISLPAPDWDDIFETDAAPDFDTPRQLIAADALNDLFGARIIQASLRRDLRERLDALCTPLAAVGTSVSPRTKRAMVGLVSAGMTLFEARDGRQPYQTAVDYAAMQRLLPKINGAGDKYREALESMIAACEKGRMDLCAERIRAIVAKGDEEAGEYVFF